MPLDINGGVSVGSSPQISGDRIDNPLTVTGAITYADSLLPTGQAVLAKPTQYTVSVTDSGYAITTGSAATTTITFTLPTMVTADLTFVFTSADNAHALNISQVGGDVFRGIGAAGAADKDLVLAAAVAQRGDYIKIRGTTGTIWSIIEARGAWTREA